MAKKKQEIIKEGSPYEDPIKIDPAVPAIIAKAKEIIRIVLRKFIIINWLIQWVNGLWNWFADLLKGFVILSPKGEAV